MPLNDNVSTRHVDYLLRRHGGITDEERITRAKAGYQRSRNMCDITVVDPGETEAVVAAFVFGQCQPMQAREGRRSALVLKKYSSDNHPVLLYGDLVSKHLASDRAPIEHGNVVTALENAFESDEEDGYSASFTSRPFRGFPLTVFSEQMSVFIDAFVDTARIEIVDAADRGLDSTSKTGPRLEGQSSFINAFRAIQKRIERGRFQRALSHFCKNLDPEALRLARATDYPDHYLYNILVGDGSAETALYRKQAFKAYPLFSDLLKQREILEKIDAGTAPPRILAAFMAGPGDTSRLNETQNTGPEAVEWYDQAIRRLHGVTKQKVGRTSVKDEARFVEMINEIPTNWQPATQSEYMAFRSVMNTAWVVADYTGRSRIDLLPRGSQSWQDIAKRLPCAADGLNDMVDRAVNNLLLPAWARFVKKNGDGEISLDDIKLTIRNQREIVAHALFGRKNLLKILEASERFHRNLTRLEAATQGRNNELAWPALTQPVTVNGHLVRPLTTQGDLSAEGDAMDHCVGGYAEACLSDSHIVSVRDNNGVRCATAQIGESANGENRDLFLQEIKGPSNTAPSKDAEKAVNRYIGWLNEPKNKPDFQAIDQGRAEIRTQQQEMRLRNRIGFDPDDLETQEAVWREWRNLAIGPARKATTYDAFIDETGIREKLEVELDRQIRKNARERGKEFNRQISERIRSQLKQSPARCDENTIQTGVMSFAEYAGLPRNGNARINHLFAEPGQTDCIRTMELDWSDAAQTETEAQRRANRIAAAMWETVQEFESIPAAIRAAARPEVVVIGHSRSEALAYKQTAQTIIAAYEPDCPVDHVADTPTCIDKASL